MFVRLMSHEIRTPLNVIMTGLRIIEKEINKHNDTKDGLHEVLTDIQLSCHVAIDLLNDLLVYEKLEAGIMTLEKSNINIVNFVKEAVRPFRIPVIPLLLLYYMSLFKRFFYLYILKYMLIYISYFISYYITYYIILYHYILT